MANKMKSASGMKSGSPKKGPIKDVAGMILSNPKVQDWLAQLITKLFSRKPKEPVAPLPPVVDKPVPNPNADDPGLIDDVIPSPKPTGRKVSEVIIRLAGGQLNRGRFPDAPDGGLLPMDILHQVEAGKAAINYGSKIWLDLTAYDEKGKEFLPGDVISHDLQYRTEHHCGDAFIKGNNGQPQDPSPYEAVDTNEVGNGISSWIATLGFKHQMKLHGEGSFECWGKVGGVESNHFTIRVS